MASLSRVDGLIWLDSRLRLQAFGVEIIVRKEPGRAFLAQNSQPTKAKELNLNLFGTRHRSMLRIALPTLGAWDLSFPKMAMFVRSLASVIALFCGTTFEFNHFETQNPYLLSSVDGPDRKPQRNNFLSFLHQLRRRWFWPWLVRRLRPTLLRLASRRLALAW